jgi:hypothetical protein
LDELTADRFEKEINLQAENEKLQTQLFGEYFKDLF